MPANAPINIERLLDEHLYDECERERRALRALEEEVRDRRKRLAMLEAIGRAADVPTDYQIVNDTPRIARAS